MRSGAGCSRRTFLLTVLVGALAAAGCGEQGAPGSAAEVPAWLPGAVGDADAAARFGRAYLAANPGEANLDTLLAAIDSALGGELDAANSDPQRVLTALQHAVRAEYLRGESVNVQGWVLSVTETRVYAVLALAADA
jgi:hypothetical protein